MSAKPIRVRWTRDDELRCALLASMGFSTRYIVAETGLTPCQVSYRLNKARIKRADYRNGESDMAQLILHRMALPNKTIVSTLKLKVTS